MLPNSLVNQLKENIKSNISELIKIRYSLHQNPELAFQEKCTQKLIEKNLAKSNYKLFDKFIETDVVTEINNNKQKTIIIRADMDALPIQEKNDLGYVSKNKGIAHACGHDGHTTIVLGTAIVLKEFAHLLPVNVRFVFQPGEEMARGGEIIVNKGVTKDIDYAYALHCWPKLKTGHIRCCSNTIFAAGSFFKITITGEGCHGATPELGNSPFPSVSHFINEMMQLHKKHNQFNSSVISICSIQGGTAPSIIPNTVGIGGTIRYLDKMYEKTIKNDIKSLVNEVKQKYSINIEISFSKDILPTTNSYEAYQHVKKTALDYLGNEYFGEMTPSKTMEDFSYFLDKVPGALFMLGVGEDKPSLHNPSFNFNDKALTNGILMFCLLALTHPS